MAVMRNSPRRAVAEIKTSNPSKRRCGFLRWHLIAVLTALSLEACVSPAARVTRVPVQPEIVQSSMRFQKEYLLTAGDQVEVLVSRVPEASHSVTIRPDGNISLPLLQDVKAAGLTPRELGAQLTTLYGQRLTNPEVTVIPSQVRASMVYVVGDVNTGSGVAVPLRDAPTAMQAVTAASGLRRSAAAREVAILRLSDDGYLQAIRVGAGVGGQPGPYMAMRSTLLRPDDVIFVPESKRSQVARFLDDFVNRPVQGINGLLGIYTSYRLIQFVTR
jgi:polysaccharide biosynthesis/export protein